MNTDQLNFHDFVQESWRIEGLLLKSWNSVVKLGELHSDYVNDWLADGVKAAEVEAFAYEITNGHGRLRCLPAMDVTVGKHIPPAGGPQVVAEFEDLCREAHTLHPFILHQRFEQLHPFLDGNGRTGRLLWLWRMIQIGEAECVIRHRFLQQWYYQSLEFWRAT